MRGVIDNGIAAGMSGPEIADQLRIELPRIFSIKRATTIARTEVHTAHEVANRRAARALKIEGLGKEWLSSQDSRVRDGSNGVDHKIMNEVRVGDEDEFAVPGKNGIDYMHGPGDDGAPAGQVINCRCTLVFSVG